MKKSLAFFGLLYLINSSFLFALPFEKAPPLYAIAEVTYTVEGKTREYLLEKYMEIPVGFSFYSAVELEEYLQDKQAHLGNQRTIAEGSVTVRLIEEVEGGPDLVYIDVWVKDTWNIVALPYGKFDSNEGLLLSLRGRNYNFLGSMETLAFNLDYMIDLEERHSISVNGEASLPFLLRSRDFVFDVSYETEYKQSLEAEKVPVYVQLDTSFGYYFSLFGKSWRSDLFNDFSINESYTAPTEIEVLAGGEIPDDYFFTTGLSLEGAVSTGLELDRHQLMYRPKVASWHSYTPGGTISPERKGLFASFEHSLDWGRINWDGNFREGYTVSLSNLNTYRFHTGDFSHRLDFETNAFSSWGWGGFNSRLQGFYRFGETSDDVGGPLRGILDKRIDNAEAGAYLNLDFPFNMWIWFMSRWFEGHLSPFVDMALFSYSPDAADTDPFWYSAGIEAFAFPKAARSFYLRISAGVDLEAVFENGETLLELYIGLGHHY